MTQRVAVQNRCWQSVPDIWRCIAEYPGGKSGLTDMVCYKRLLYMVGFLRPSATTSGWTTFSIGYCNSEIQDGVQDGRHNLKSPWYHQLLLYFHMQYIVSMVFEVRQSTYDGFRVIWCNLYHHERGGCDAVCPNFWKSKKTLCDGPTAEFPVCYISAKDKQ